MHPDDLFFDSLNSLYLDGEPDYDDRYDEYDGDYDDPFEYPADPALVPGSVHSAYEQPTPDSHLVPGYVFGENGIHNYDELPYGYVIVCIQPGGAYVYDPEFLIEGNHYVKVPSTSKIWARTN